MLRAKLLEKQMGKQTISARQQVSRLGTLLAWHSEKASVLASESELVSALAWETASVLVLAWGLVSAWESHPQYPIYPV